MKVELQNGDRITIPEGCKAQINGNEVVIEKEEVQEFKDGDVLACKDSLNITCPFIYKNTDEAGFHLFYIGLNCDGFIEKADSINSRWGDNTLRLATEEEKQQLFDKMKEEGLRWNAEEKRVEKVRWRAENGEDYYHVDNQGNTMIDREYCHYVDKSRYEFGNYFRNDKQAEEAAKRMKDVLHKYHEEMGE